MNVLDDVRRIHPVIGKYCYARLTGPFTYLWIDVVVLAFKAVITLELKRRDNDQKVLVLQVKLQDMMEVFVQ